MKVIWIMAVHRLGVTIFQRNNIETPLALVTEIKNPEGLKKEGDLTSDKPGRITNKDGVRHALSAEQNQREHTFRQFLMHVSTDIEKEAYKNVFDELVVIADSRILGILRKCLGTMTLTKLKKIINKNLYFLGDNIVDPSHIEKCLKDHKF